MLKIMTLIYTVAGLAFDIVNIDFLSSCFPRLLLLLFPLTLPAPSPSSSLHRTLPLFFYLLPLFSPYLPGL